MRVNKKNSSVFEGEHEFFLLISNDFQVISRNNNNGINIPYFKPGDNFIESLQKIIPEQNKTLLNEIKSAIDHVIENKENVLLEGNDFVINNNENEDCSWNIKLVPLFEKDVVRNILVYWNCTQKKETKSSLQKVFEVEKKLFSVHQKDLSFKTTLKYIINIIEENSPDLLCSIINIENGIVYTTTSAEFPNPFYNELNAKVREASKSEQELNKETVDSIFSILKDTAKKHDLQTCRCYSLTGANNGFLGMLNIFCKKERELSLKELKILKIITEISVILIEKENALLAQSQNNEILNNIGEVLPGVIFQFIKKPNGKYKFTYVTEKIKSLYNLELEEIYEDANKVFSQVHHEDYEELMKSIEFSSENLSPWQFVFRTKRRKVNAYRWIRGNATPVKKDNLIVWNGTLIDITEFHEIAEKSIEAERRYHLIYDKNPLTMMVVEKENLKLIDVNNSAINTFGYTEKELLQISLSDLIPEDDLNKLKRELESLKPGMDLRFQTKNIKKSGEIIDVEFIITEIKYKDTKAYIKIVTDVTEKLKSEALIKKQNLLFRELFNASPFGIVMFDKEERIIQVNKAFENLFQYKEEEIKNKYIKELIVPEEKEAESDKIFNDVMLPSVIQKETYRKRKDQSTIDTLIVYYPIISQDEILGFYGIYVDISSQKEAERNIKQEKDFTDSIINSIPGIIYVLNIDKEKLHLVLWNENLREITGYTDEEIRKITPEKLFNGTDAVIIRNKLEEVKNKGKADAEVKIISKSGQETLYYFTGVLSKIALQKYIIGMGIDVTERNKYQQMLRIQERALESVAEGVVIADNTKPGCPIMYVNPEFCKITGYTQEEVIGQNIFFLTGPKTRKKSVLEMQDALENKSTYRGEILSYCRNGQTFWNLMILAPVFNDEKEATHFIGMINNISDIKEWQQKLEENNFNLKKTNEELDRFVYSTSHDLRAPLTSVLGLINIAQTESDPELTKDFLKRMKNSVLKLDSFIQDIVNYSRNTRLKILKEEIDFKKLIGENIEKLEYMEGAKEIGFNTSINETENTRIYSDKNRLNVIISNLISNAIKYQDKSKEHKKININIEVKKDKAIMIIEDNGIGIPKEYQKKVFEMFFRASVQSTGSGLGLYIVKEMVNKLNGKIKIDSTPGEGTSIQVEIPNLKAE